MLVPEQGHEALLQACLLGLQVCLLPVPSHHLSSVSKILTKTPVISDEGSPKDLSLIVSLQALSLNLVEF